MSETRGERMRKFSEMHVAARMKAGKSQEFMAMELGVAKKTVQNWEKGFSSPSFFQSLEWFRVLDIDPFPYYQALMYPNKYNKSKNMDSDEEINESFAALVNHLSINDKKTWLHLYYGEHGISPDTLLQLLLAYAHSPLETRITQAVSIYNVFMMEEERGNLICTDDIMPDMDWLDMAITRARAAAIQHKRGYSLIVKEEESDDMYDDAENAEKQQ